MRERPLTDSSDRLAVYFEPDCEICALPCGARYGHTVAVVFIGQTTGCGASRRKHGHGQHSQHHAQGKQQRRQFLFCLHLVSPPCQIILTVAPFSGFVQVALAPISQKLCGAPAPIRIFCGNHGEIPLISLDPDSLGLSPESPTPVPKAFHLRKGHSTCHPPLRTGVYQTRNCRYPLAPSQM